MLAVPERNLTSLALLAVSLVAAPASAAIAGVHGLAGLMTLTVLTPPVVVALRCVARAWELRPRRERMAV